MALFPTSLQKIVSANIRFFYTRIRLFFMLPRCYREVRALEECKKSGLGIAFDLLRIFFSYKTYPHHYGPCRLWEVEKKEWKYYYGSNFHFPQNTKLLQKVQPYEYRIIFDDKYFTMLLCRDIGIRMPHTYGVLNLGENHRAQIRAWFQASSSKAMIIKPVRGARGSDIYLARKIDNGIAIQSSETVQSLDEFDLKGRSIVQEVLSQHPQMSAISPSSLNTLRIVTMITLEDEVIVVNASVRFAVGKAFVDNFSAGGVSAGINCETGKLKKYGYDSRGNVYLAHPTTGVIFENCSVPEWGRVCRTATTIQRAFPFYRLLGLDIAIEQGGEPVLIEANAAPDLTGLEQKAGPLLKTEQNLRAFGQYDLLINKHQKKLYNNLNNISKLGNN